MPVDKLADKDLSFLYVFVDIQFDKDHFVASLKAYFPAGTHIALVSTIQFVATLQAVKQELQGHFEVSGFFTLCPCQQENLNIKIYTCLSNLRIDCLTLWLTTSII